MILLKDIETSSNEVNRPTPHSNNVELRFLKKAKEILQLKDYYMLGEPNSTVVFF